MKTIKKLLAISILFVCLTTQSQNEKSNFWHPSPPNYEVEQAVEVESLFPMFFTGGFHVGIGYRYKKFRLRVSVINGGTYNADQQAIGATDENYNRYYTTSPGIFFGYNVWRNLEIYGYYENHNFDIEQISTGETLQIPSNDVGIGMSYQFFIGRTFYIQPGIHSYFRAAKEIQFSNADTYNIPTFEISPIIRVGARLWKIFD